MTEAAREKYDRAVRLALAAIRAPKGRVYPLKKPIVEVLVQAMRAKTARGEAVTETEIGALASAIAAQHVQKRGRGRPKGTADFAAKWAFSAAYIATVGTELTNYRNSASGPRLTLCDALAEAMNAANYTSLTTYDAATAEMKATRKSCKRAAETMRAAWQQFSGLEKLAEAMSENYTSLATYDAATAGLGSIWHSVKRTAEIANALTEAMSATNFTSLATYDAAAVGLGSIWRSSNCTAGIMTRRDARAEAANAAIITSLTTYDALAEAMNAANYTSLTTYDAAAVGLGSIWRSSKCTAEIANAVRRSEDSFSGLEKLAKAMSAATQLSPQIIDGLKSAAKTKR